MSLSSPLPTALAAPQPDLARAEPGRKAPVRSIHVVDADLATFDLMREWLEPEGWRLIELESAKLGTAGRDRGDGGTTGGDTGDDGTTGRDKVDGDATETPSLVIVDLAYPRDAALPALMRLRDALPGVPLLVMSPTIFDGVGCCGPCARQLGVAGVLPKPLSREALVAAIANLVLPSATTTA